MNVFSDEIVSFFVGMVDKTTGAFRPLGSTRTQNLVYEARGYGTCGNLSDNEKASLQKGRPANNG
jgi:hypothetical protein